MVGRRGGDAIELVPSDIPLLYCILLYYYYYYYSVHYYILVGVNNLGPPDAI